MKVLNTIMYNWEIPKELTKNTNYRYYPDIINSFYKFYFCYLLENKRMDICIYKVKLFMICYSLYRPEFDNKEMKIFFFVKIIILNMSSHLLIIPKITILSK